MISCAGPPLAPASPDAAPQPLAPSPSDSVAITAQVLEYRTGRPIEQASVFLDHASVGKTGADGTLITEAERGRELTMYAVADGYERSLTVSGTPYGAERWTFYLEPVSD